jgi:hypothetical protein
MITYKIKFQSTLLVAILTLLAFSLLECSSGKYYSDFKTRKKSIEKLAVCRPTIFVKSVKGQKQSEDYELCDKLKKQIFEKTSSILSSKYKLTAASDINDSIPEKDLQALFSKLDNSGKQLSSIKIPPFLQKDFNNIKERYCLMIFFQGSYNGYLKPNEDFKQALQSNTIYLNEGHPYRSDIRIVVVDILENNLVYYDKKVSNDIDPRLPIPIDQMISSILRTLYYK